MSEQLTLNLPSEPALGRGDYFIAPSNAAAVEAIQSWHDWPQGKMLLVGPARSGKTHLAHVWAAMVGARIAPAAEVPGQVEALAAGPIAVEDADRIAGDRAAEEALFHLHNLALQNGAPLLITAATPPARWDLSLPDIKSRLQGTGMVSLDAPDDQLLAAVLVKLFADRQIALDADLLPYLMIRMERSFAGAGRLVDALDQAALAQKRRITKALAGPVLDKLATEAS
ncbi:Chromosomal replication initiator protein DnaA [Candidatus Rhodobacter oscarellae]|uniref:Chromosomal replication initiator protein DnaA n=1 Tax=Candidatus Rhodobacter oscarellae TaxID=1675527 RepID=A0A0J9E163_9RHOB|nr:DnaA/Hda family protein [Candidatus Rhodobacter lobularis]KMW56427.1 Chromosomal replication initiator protein DnaA [Candidatus Rhodobacter lobularis]